MPLPRPSDDYGFGLKEGWEAGTAVLRRGRVAVGGGRHVAYVEAGAGGETCLLLHGIANTWRFWTAVAAGLSEGRRVIAFDLPGFGDSDLPAGRLTARTLGDVLVAASDALGVGRAAVCGHSMGGLVALSMATTHPDRIERAVVVGGALLGVLALYDGAATCARHPVRAARFASVVLQGALPTPDWFLDRIATSRALRRLFLGTYLRWPARLPPGPLRDCMVGLGRPGVLRAAANAGRFDLPATVAATHCPVLLVNGDHDRLSPLEDAERLATLLPAGRLAILENTGHWPMIERPAELIHLVGDFLASGQPQEWPR
ncbi:MAG: alpha/beta fold hydrolase [Acidimicrobiales bacterium]